MSIFYKSAEFVQKHRGHRHFALATLALVFVGMGAYTYRQDIARAATFTFTQSSWAGGISATTATHTSNQTNWSQYSATSTNIVAGAGGVSLPLTSYTATDDGTFTTTGSATGSGFGRLFDSFDKLLIHSDGIDGSTIFTDEAGKTVTAYGNAQIDNGAQDIFGGGSGLFDGSGDYLTVPYTSDFDLSSGDWTMEALFRSNSFASTQIIISKDTYGSNFDWAIIILNSTTLQLSTHATTQILTVNVPTMNTGQLYHIAYVRNAGVNTIYLDGVAYGSNTMTIANSSQSYVTIGCAGWNNPNAFFNGWLDEIHISKGIARWTTNFLPPSMYSHDIVVTGSGSAASVGLAATATSVAFMTATGGTITTDGDYKVHTFTGSGTFTVSGLGTDPTYGDKVEYLVVAGGGGGGGRAGGGGGGAGGYRTATGFTVAAQGYPITVGAGGSPGNGAGTVGTTNGNDSVFSTITSLGGGGAGTYPASMEPPDKDGSVGSSGGGGATASNNPVGIGAGGTAGQGYAGGNGENVTNTSGGGGGGAGGIGASGGSATPNRGGLGGIGLSSSISGASSDYAGGGSGGAYYGSDTASVGYGGGAGFSLLVGGNGIINTGGGGGGGGGLYDGGSGGSGIVIIRYKFQGTTNFATSGTFTSAVINTGATSAFTTLAYTATLNSQTITMDARAGNTATPDGTWTAWQTGIASGGSIAGLAGNQYIQYRANLSTTNTIVTPTIDSVTISYNQYPASGNLTSSRYDAESAVGIISNMMWTAVGTTDTEVVKFQVRSSADGTTWTNWCGPSTACLGTDYFTLDTGVSGGITSGHPLRTGGDDRYAQYKAFLLSGGEGTPTITSATIQYVINTAPAVSNVIASQSSNGLVTVGYDVSDADNGIGNIVDVTLQYCTTNCSTGTEVWADAVTVSGNVGTGVAIGTGKSITWTPSTDYATQYKANTQTIRIKANDRDAANNLGYGTSNTFTLDTTVPAVTATLDSSGTQDVASLTTTDNSTLEYRLCNTACDTETWTAITSGVATPVNWNATGAPNAETVYLQVRDQYGNTTAQTLVAPATPTALLAADVSNPSATSFGETLSWMVTPNAISYKVYEAHTASASTVPSSYALLASPSTNVYNHSISTATTSAYWYRVAAVNANGDISNFTTAQTTGDVPDSFGTTLADTTAPIISAITVPAGTLRNTSAVVTFTTDELATAQVLYGTTHASSCNYGGTPAGTTSYVTAQSVTLTGLTANTLYYYCVRATDVLSNVSAGVDGGTFTTASGPIITGVTTPAITDTSVTILWNTSTSSDSYVYYSTNASVVNPLSAGSATLVSCVVDVCQHQVVFAGLSAGTTYYYYVKSTDGTGNYSIDNNSGAYYSFVTTIDITPPLITNIATPVTSSSALVVVWETDELATSQVLWGTTTGDRSKYTTTDATKSIYHVVTLSSATTNSGSAGGTNELAPSTPYYYVVKSVDTAGNTRTSDEQTVTTPSTGNVTIVAVSVVNRVVNAPDVVIPDTTAPTVSNVKVSEITPFEAAVGFETSENAVSFVEYGKSALYGDNAGSKTWSKTHSIKLRGLTLGTDYHIKVSAVDKAGNTGTGSEQTFKTNFITEDIKEIAKIENIEQFQKEIEATIESILPSLVPPFITKPVISDITENSAKISFKSNIKAFPVVVFADAGAYDDTKENPYTGEMSDIAERATSHEFVLTGLKGNTKYHVQARGFSLPKVIGKSADVEFITSTSKIVGSIVERKKDSFTVVWTTEEPTSSIVEFKDLKRGIAGRKTDNAIKTSHSMKIENLPSGTAYEVNLSGVTEQGNVAEAGSPLSVRTSTDVTKPVISGFKVDNALVPGRTDRIQTIVSWVTDEPSNAVVYYEEDAGKTGDTAELANKNEILDSYTISHSVILPSLKPGTIYRLKVTSSDDSGNEGSFGPRTVITPKQTESITDIIFKNFEDSFKFLRKI